MSVRCIVYKNTADHGEGRMMAVPGSMNAFLKSAGEKLGMKASKAFTENGALIDDVALIRDDERIFISTGEAFFKSADNSRVRTYKIAILGSGGVGKSCLSMRYVRSTFVDIYDPTIEDAFRHQTVVDNHVCILDILDTAGQEDMRMLRRQWVEHRDGFLLAFSLIDRSSFDDLGQFFDLIAEVKESTLAQTPHVLVGNKVDMADRRQVTTQEAEELAKKHNAIYVEASAKTGENVDRSFESLVREFIRIDPPKPVETSGRRRNNCHLL
eukprot:TRINITY_DN377_c2_g1_i1.p1 TRINITY_DN377_c2_g1~~TRINITY_DN377_c2_g1_i1.p1  ORF type:complete len:269 (-),score=114.01 TRINITY_DN377_c2_g1_i1:54-860(-)